MYSNGNSFSNPGGCALGGAEGPCRPVPGWKFGVSPQSRNEDRGSI